jgi:DNA repair protein RadC
MNNVSLALSVSNEIPLFPEAANALAPIGQGLPVQAPPEVIVPSAGEDWKCTAESAMAQVAAPELASQSPEGVEILRRLLAPVLAESETGRAADQLLARFGTLGATLSADAMQLGDVVGKAVTDHLQITYLALQRALREQIPDRPIIGSWSALEEYAALKLRHSSDEKLLALFLDGSNGLIQEECMEQGAFDQTPRYCREIARRALELRAHAVALAHNHPTGDPVPSRADVEITKRIIVVLSNLEMVLHDHAIVGRNTIMSMRSMQLI